MFFCLGALHHIDTLNHLIKFKEYIYKMSHKDSTKRTEYFRDYYEKNKERVSDRKKEHYDDKTQHAYNSILHGEILDHHKWDSWCGKIKRGASKHPYSEDFTNDVMFDMMIKGCFYCEDIATTIDRVNSKLDHTPGNCVGSCNTIFISACTAVAMICFFFMIFFITEGFPGSATTSGAMLIERVLMVSVILGVIA
jgi:hypothetical protein